MSLLGFQPRHNGVAMAVTWTHTLARHVVWVGMMGTRCMGVLARLAVHSSLTYIFVFFLFCLSLLWLPYNTLWYFMILPREGKEVTVLFPCAYLLGTLGLRPLKRGLNQMHVLKQNKKTVFSNSNYLQLTGIGAGVSTVHKHFVFLADHSRICFLLDLGSK